MPTISNARHERMAQGLAAGKTADQAYKAAGYKADRGHAARLAAKGHIQDRVRELVGRAADAVVLSKQWVLDRLIENANRAMQAEPVMRDGVESGEYTYQGGAANRALELLGKELGMFVDRKEIRSGPLDSMDSHELARLREELVNERDRRLAGGTGTGATGAQIGATVPGHGTA